MNTGMARSTKRNQIGFAIVALVLVIMMNIQSRSTGVLLSADSAFPFISVPNLATERVAEFQRINPIAARYRIEACDLSAMSATECPLENYALESSDGTSTSSTCYNDRCSTRHGDAVLVGRLTHSTAKRLRVFGHLRRFAREGFPAFDAVDLAHRTSSLGLSAGVTATWIRSIFENHRLNQHLFSAVGAVDFDSHRGSAMRTVARMAAELLGPPSGLLERLSALRALGHTSIFSRDVVNASTVSPTV